MNMFPGSTNLCRLLAKYKPLNVLPWYYKGPFGGLRDPKIGQNDQIFDFWVHFLHIYATKVSNEYIFW